MMPKPHLVMECGDLIQHCQVIAQRTHRRLLQNKVSVYKNVLHCVNNMRNRKSDQCREDSDIITDLPSEIVLFN